MTLNTRSTNIVKTSKHRLAGEFGVGNLAKGHHGHLKVDLFGAAWIGFRPAMVVKVKK